MESLAKHLAEATVYLGRQPIYGAKRDIRAYELLYRRSAGDTTARFQDADQASADVMLKAFLEIGLPTVSPLQPVFINHTRYLLTLDPILPPDRCVIEVLEDVAAEPGTLAALRHLKSLKPVFINHTRYLLTLDPILPPDRCVIEVLEDVAAEPGTLAALRHLKSLK